MKDPAFLFYPNDFVIGTQFMTDAEVGMYVRILCAMHQHGRLNELQFNSLCHGNATAMLRGKFQLDESGNYYNERLELEITKRKQFSERQSVKAKKRWNNESHGNATAMPIVNVNEIENEVINDNRVVKGFKKPELFEVEDYFLENYLEPKETASHFYDHYESNGWKVGRNSMKDWKGAVRNWMRNKKNFNKNGTKDEPKIGRIPVADIARFIKGGNIQG